MKRDSITFKGNAANDAFMALSGKPPSSPSPCSVELTSRQVIERKLLTALEDDNTVAALLSKRDLEDMIAALYGFEDMGNSAPRKKRCKDLADSMSQLLREAFPPNADLSDPASKIKTERKAK